MKVKDIKARVQLFDYQPSCGKRKLGIRSNIVVNYKDVLIYSLTVVSQKQ